MRTTVLLLAQLSAAEESEDGVAGVAGLAGVYESGSGVVAGPRSMHSLSRLPQLLVQPVSFREPLPSDVLSLTAPGSSWEGITAAPSTSRPQVNPAFVVAKPVSIGEDLPSPASQAPRTVAYRAYS